MFQGCELVCSPARQEVVMVVGRLETCKTGLWSFLFLTHVSRHWGLRIPLLSRYRSLVARPSVHGAIADPSCVEPIEGVPGSPWTCATLLCGSRTTCSYPGPQGGTSSRAGKGLRLFLTRRTKRTCFYPFLLRLSRKTDRKSPAASGPRVVHQTRPIHFFSLVGLERAVFD